MSRLRTELTARVCDASPSGHEFVPAALQTMQEYRGRDLCAAHDRRVGSGHHRHRPPSRFDQSDRHRTRYSMSRILGRPHDDGVGA